MAQMLRVLDLSVQDLEHLAPIPVFQPFAQVKPRQEKLVESAKLIRLIEWLQNLDGSGATAGPHGQEHRLEPVILRAGRVCLQVLLEQSECRIEVVQAP